MAQFVEGTGDDEGARVGGVGEAEVDEGGSWETWTWVVDESESCREGMPSFFILRASY